MKETLTSARLEAALARAVERLRRERRAEGYWEGRLSSSAVGTAMAVGALGKSGEPQDAGAARRGGEWLVRSQNAEGGWGDTPDGPSSLTATLLAAAALWSLGPEAAPGGGGAARDRAERYLTATAGATPQERVAAVRGVHGGDQSFAVPVLIYCALAGRIPWELVPRLPHELALLPSAWYTVLPRVVPYALPVLIATGLVTHRFRPTRQPLWRGLREVTREPALRRLGELQPDRGAFLQAIAAAGLVAACLLPLYGPRQPVVARCREFLRETVREDGSWPVVRDMSVWVTAGAMRALQVAGGLTREEDQQTREWLWRARRGEAKGSVSAPQGWGSTHLPGPPADADDTAAALLVLAGDGAGDGVEGGVAYLLSLQNREGGWATFCRGQRKLLYEVSCPDLTAHALLALQRLSGPPGEGDGVLPAPLRHRAARARERGLRYLAQAQGAQGAWTTPWFGAQAAPEGQNPVVGTALALQAYAGDAASREEAVRGRAYLLRAQNPDGGWGGAEGLPSTVEETALTVRTLAGQPETVEAATAANRGAAYLVARVEDGTWTAPSPIGLYLPHLWYAEEAYPLMWTVEALAVVARARRAGWEARPTQTEIAPVNPRSSVC